VDLPIGPGGFAGVSGMLVVSGGIEFLCHFLCHGGPPRPDNARAIPTFPMARAELHGIDHKAGQVFFAV
jgi:hypothetical protein